MRRLDSRAVDEFFRLHVGTRQRLGIPTQPRRFFRGLTAVQPRPGLRPTRRMGRPPYRRRDLSPAQVCPDL